MNELLLCLLVMSAAAADHAAPTGAAGAAGARPAPDTPAVAVPRLPPPWTTAEPPLAVAPAIAHDSVAARDRDRWLGSDKFRHFLLSYAVTAFTFASLRSGGVPGDDALAGGMAGAAVAGVGKEVYDRRSGGVFSWRDLVADGVGIMTAYFLLREVR